MNSGSVLAPTPSPAVTRLMMPAEMATAARADTTDTAITPRCIRWRRKCSARPRSTPVSPLSRRSRTLRVGVAEAARSSVAAESPDAATAPDAGIAPITRVAEEPSAASGITRVSPATAPAPASSSGFSSRSLSAEACRNCLYTCDATVDTTEPTATPMTEPAMPIFDDSSIDVTAANAPAATCGTDKPSSSPPSPLRSGAFSISAASAKATPFAPDMAPAPGAANAAFAACAPGAALAAFPPFPLETANGTATRCVGAGRP